MAGSPAAIVREWFEELWNKGDASTIDRLMHPDAVIHGLPTPTGEALRGTVQFKPFHQAFRAAFPDIAIELVHVVVEGELGIGHCRVRGTHRGDLPDLSATNRRIDITGFAMARIVDGQVRESWNCFDFLNMYHQLGAQLAVPPASRTAGA